VISPQTQRSVSPWVAYIFGIGSACIRFPVNYIERVVLKPPATSIRAQTSNYSLLVYCVTSYVYVGARPFSLLLRTVDGTQG